MEKNFLKTRTPAKLIISGEHAVVYGYPALAVAINRYMEVTVRWTLLPLHFSFYFMGINFRRQITLQTLRKLKRKLKNQYDQYCSGHLNIREVLQKPFELSLFTFINVLDRLKNKLPTGIDIVTNSNIPVGYGMGSSAASVVSLIYALTQFLNINLKLEDYLMLGIESENLQHGYSSGLDVHTVYHGGCLRYEKGTFEKRTFPDFAVQLVRTGQPKSSSGECVSQVASFFKRSSIGNDFSAVTNALDKALQNEDRAEIKNCIRQNHHLLRTIGVVPDKINAFIVDIEKIGGAAKICGAGSVRGNNGGAVLVITDNPLIDLSRQYGYSLISIQTDNQGTHVV
ncbi:mevalonate kinase [Coxiella endosymbiont of Amblyomma nuttalli]|uniref:mevalonate kinase n=1 Tax=Coxiella endosymbiont of Amblyomma nuttalli TaxID=2749996 RepID=UPI001BAD8D6F|nr:mevalonate kinase [Coxiella endosymbiont of Amblyomma nuttalli]QTS83707.1 GHMP kinase family protein [Coxiella endosymbiont of Amblyomma nuttalli]